MIWVMGFQCRIDQYREDGMMIWVGGSIGVHFWTWIMVGHYLKVSCKYLVFKG